MPILPYEGDTRSSVPPMCAILPGESAQFLPVLTHARKRNARRSSLPDFLSLGTGIARALCNVTADIEAERSLSKMHALGTNARGASAR